MRKEALIFVGSFLVSTVLFGIGSVGALMIFGFAWLVFGDD